MDRKSLRQYQLSSDTEIKPFHCTEQDLNGFLFDDAKRYQAELMAVTYLIEDTDKDVTVAYYSLLADKISFNPEEKSTWNKINRNIPNNKRRKNYPAVKIGRLAVSEDHTGYGLGSMIIRNIMYTFTRVKRLGCRFLTVDALRSALPFYEKCGFKFFTEEDKEEETRLMFFDLKNFTEY